MATFNFKGKVFKSTKNDFSVEYYKNSKRIITMNYVHNINTSNRWVNRNVGSFDFIIVYNRRKKLRIFTYDFNRGSFKFYN